MYFDTIVIQQWSDDRRAELTRSFANGRADEAAIRLAAGRTITWLGNLFISWGQQMQTGVNYRQPVQGKA